MDLLGLGPQLFGQGQHRGLEGRQGRVQVEHHPDVVLAVFVLAHHFLVVGVAEEGQGHAVGAQGGLDHVGDVPGVLLLVEIGQVFAGVLLVALEVVVGAVGDAPQLAPAEGEEVLHVGGGFGVEGQLLGPVVPEADVFLRHAQAEQPAAAELLPVGEPLQVRVGLAEELQLHLLELPGAEGKVAGGDLVAEALADLADAEGQLLPGGALHVGEVDEDALGGLGAEVDLVFRVLGHALEGFEHQVELADLGEILAAAVGALDVVLLDEGHHLVVGPAVGRLAGEVLDELVRPVAGLAVFTVHEGVGEAAHVAGGHPHLGVHQNGGVHAHIVGGLLDELLPPGFFYVVLEFYPQGAVVPGVGQAAVDLAAGVDKAPGLAEVHDGVHGLFGRFHKKARLSRFFAY